MTTKKVVTYLRISTANQIDNTSIETQREKINLYCKLNDINIIKEFKDEAISAKHEHTREDYQKLIKFIADKKNKIDLDNNDNVINSDSNVTVTEENKKENKKKIFIYHDLINQWKDMPLNRIPL